MDAACNSRGAKIRVLGLIPAVVFPSTNPLYISSLQLSEVNFLQENCKTDKEKDGFSVLWPLVQLSLFSG